MYLPHTKLDNHYHQPYKIGDIVWYVWYNGAIGKYKIILINRKHNINYRRDGRIFYWLEPLDNHTRRIGSRNGYIGHDVSIDEIMPTKEMANRYCAFHFPLLN